MKRGIGVFAAGLLLGALLFGGGVSVEAGVVAEPSANRFYVDGEQVSMRAYRIDGENYVRLRDVGQAVGFNVYWQDGVRMDTFSMYTGEPPQNGVGLWAEKDSLGETARPATPQELDTIRREIILRTNELRRAKGLPVLKMDEKTMEAAQVRAEEMAASSIYTHTRPDGRRRTTVTDCPYTTENIHCISQWRLNELGEDVAEVAVREWAESGEHLSGMLDETREFIGVGVAQGRSPTSGLPSWYCVQWFLREGCQITWVDQPVFS